MKKVRKVLLITSISLCLLTVMLLGIMLFFPRSYVNIALANVFVIPLIFGIALMLIWLILKSEKKWTFKAIFIKLFLAFLLFLVLKNATVQPVIIAVKDLQATISEEYYLAKGVVQDTRIRRKSGSKLNGLNRRDTFIQYFSLDNEENDTFSYHVSDMEDYRFEEGKTYKIIALPYSKQILEYEEL